MIYLFAGDDTKKKIINYEKFIEKIPKDVEVFFVVKKDFDFGQIENFALSNSLFFKQSMVVFSQVFENEDIKDFLFKKINIFSESTNIFVFIENKFLKSELDIFKKARAEINYFELPKEKKEKFNNFLLANAFGVGDKKNLWIYYRQAVDLGVGLEELVGVLFWKIKDMILRKNFYKFSEEKLKKIASRLSYLLPEARKRGKNAEVEFEKFLIEVFE